MPRYKVTVTETRIRTKTYVAEITTPGPNPENYAPYLAEQAYFNDDSDEGWEVESVDCEPGRAEKV